MELLNDKSQYFFIKDAFYDKKVATKTKKI